VRYRTSFEREVVVRECWIPMPDGVRLHARIWRPRDAEASPVPALLEYLPTARGTGPRRATPSVTLVRRARLRLGAGRPGGSGNSEASCSTSTPRFELDDAVAVIHWLASRPWCTGKVGMFGISWGGFNALQVAALRPEPAARRSSRCARPTTATTTMCTTPGGAVLGVDMLAWAGTMLAFHGPPTGPGGGRRPVARHVARALGRRRAVPAHLARPTRERDDYWRHGSVCEDYSAVRAACLAVGGWADPYRDTGVRLAEHPFGAPMRGDRRPVVAPVPGPRPARPAIGFLQETLRWWDQWLKGATPACSTSRCCAPGCRKPRRAEHALRVRPGRWVGDDCWPSPAVAPRRVRASTPS